MNRYYFHTMQTKNVLKKYIAEVDKIISDKEKDDARTMEVVNDTRYSETYKSEYMASHDMTTHYRTRLKDARNVHYKNAMRLLDLLEQDTNEYFNGGVSSDFSNKLIAMSTLGVKPSRKELELLETSAHSYPELRLLQEYANKLNESNKVPTSAVAPDGSITATETKDVYNFEIPFTVDLPDIDKVYSDLNAFKMFVKSVLDGYCGANLELSKCIYSEDLPEWVQSYGTGLVPVYVLNDGSNIERETKSILKTLDNATKCLPEKQKSELTDDERALIDTIIDPNYPYTAPDKAKAIARKSPELGELLLLDERYRATVEKVYMQELDA